MPPTSLCARCGASNAPTSRFCNGCGEKMVPSVGPVASACSKCGSAVNGMKFCPSCGELCAASSVPRPRALDLSDFEEKKKKERMEREEQFERAREISAAKRAMAEAKFAQLEREMQARPSVQPQNAPSRLKTSSPFGVANSQNCRECGTNTANMKFCPSCGTPARRNSPPPQVAPLASATSSLSRLEDSQNCRECGTNTANMKFCPSCGAPARRNSPPPQTAPIPSASTASSRSSSQNFVRVQAVCDQCGAVAANATPKFCADCGNSFTASQPRADNTAQAKSPAKTNTPTCRQCNSNVAGMKFCLSCGTPTGQPSVQASQSIGNLATAAQSATATSSIASKYLSNLNQSGSTNSGTREAVSVGASVVPTIISQNVNRSNTVLPSNAIAQVSSSAAQNALRTNSIPPSTMLAAAPVAMSAINSSIPRGSTAASSSRSIPTPPHTFVPPQDGTGHVYTMTQTVTRSVTYNA